MRLVSSAITPACSPRSGATPPTTLVPPPNGHDCQRALRAQRQQSRQLLGAVGEHDRVWRPVRFARAQPHEVRVALAGGVHDAFGVIVANILEADDRA